MRGKMMFLGGVAVGFVLGTRAGRERYEQLVSAARQLREHPTVQEAAGVVQAQANRVYAEGKEAVTDKLGNSKLGERFGHEPGQPGAGAGATDQDPLAGTGKRPPTSTF